MAPPASIRATHRLSADEVIQFMVVLEAEYFRMEGDYATFIQTHLMPPLTGVHEDKGVRAPAVRVTRRASRASTARGRGTPRAERRAGWPEFLTELTGWRYSREAYQIPIKPPLAGHRYVRALDAPPASTEYVEGLLEMLASLEGMILRRESILSFHGIEVPPLPTAVATAAVRPSVPSPAAGRGGR
ncbi:uncharacterized protein LOC114278545 [Camellia sinensis]|uniref:uncharacterized protein LOC114278545 n=1 Tax=Camellia sinensis TaxID=4442 RepID=UPI001036516A|nr:uncharacterized protein LOC114278545 [Camellia sinensis]